MYIKIQNSLCFASKLFSTGQLIRFSGQKILLPLYHLVSNYEVAHIKNLYPTRNLELFERDLDFLCKNFNPVSLDELEGIIHSGRKIEKPIFHLTFDDGLRQIYDEVSPVLIRKGIPASIFVNTDFIDNKKLFYRYKVSLIIDKLKDLKCSLNVGEILGLNTKDCKMLKNRMLSLNYHECHKIDKIASILGIDFNEYLQKEQPYLSSLQIEFLIKHGFNIGSHSVDHPKFKDIETSVQKQQVTQSFQVLEKKFNIDNLYFSFPFSDESVPASFFKWLFDQTNCRISFGISGLKKDCSRYHLHRVPFEKNLLSAQEIVKKEYFYYLLKSFVNKNKINRE